MFRSINPATDEQIATYPELSPGEIEGKLAAAASSFARWRLIEIPERLHLLDKLADTFLAKKDTLAHMVTSEMGKTLVSATAEVEKCAKAFRYYAQNGAA